MWVIAGNDPNPSKIPSTCYCALKDRSCLPQELLNQVEEVDDLNTEPDSFETWMIAGVDDDLTTLVIKDCNRMTLLLALKI